MILMSTRAAVKWDDLFLISTRAAVKWGDAFNVNAGCR